MNRAPFPNRRNKLDTILGDLERLFYAGVGRYVKDRRTILRRSVEDVSRSIGMSPGTFRNVEQGRKIPLDWLVRISRTLQVPVTSLLPTEHPWTQDISS